LAGGPGGEGNHKTKRPGEGRGVTLVNYGKAARKRERDGGREYLVVPPYRDYGPGNDGALREGFGRQKGDSKQELYTTYGVGFLCK